MTTPLISVVILAYAQFELTTLPCLNSLRTWLNDPELEFIVYDNASPDGSGEKALDRCRSHPQTHFVQSPTNLGYAGGMNAAAQHAKGQWLFLVNNDTEFAPHAIDALKKVLKSAPPNMAMIGPITNAAGNGQRLYAPSTSKEAWLELGAWLNTHPTGLLLPTYRCDFFCIAIRREAWDQLNGLDTIFGLGYFEDFDFSLRLRKEGFDQAITEDVFVYHQSSASFSSPADVKQLIDTNKKLLIKKHQNVHFIHARDCNITIVEKYIGHNAHNLFSEDPRFKIRVAATKLDEPKSLIKKLLWRKKIKFLLNHKSLKK